MKKILSLIIAVLILFSAITSYASDYIAVRNNNHLNAVKKLGILDAYTENGVDETDVTRGEFASVLSKMIGMEGQWVSENPFSDVNQQTEYYSEILLMNKLGIMVGDTSGRFMPEAPVTYAQAAKCMIYILGYTIRAEANGGYPTGYLIWADKLKLLKWMENNINEAVSRAALAEMVYNSLDVNLSEISGVEEDTIYNENKGNTILSKYFGLVKKSGVLNAVDGRSIKTRDSVSADGYLQIGETLYTYSDTSVSDYLGCYVDFYATNETGKVNDIIIIYPSVYNQELIIAIDDLETSRTEFSLTKFYYTDSTGKSKKADITSQHRFLYNGAFDFDFDLPDLNFSTGYVKLIDNNDDNEYDVVSVWNYDDFVVDYISNDNIIGKYNQAMKREDDIDYRVLSYNGLWGDWEMLEDVSEWDVLSVATSKDINNPLVTIQISRGGVAGKLESISTDTFGSSVIIDGQSYTVSPQYIARTQNTGYVEIEPNLESEFYFNIMGQIAAIYKSATDVEQYGYLLAVGQKSGIDGKYEAKIFTEDGKIVIFKTNDKIKITSLPLYNDKQVDCAAAFNEFKSSGTLVQQLIKYTVNEEGLLTSVKKASDATALGYDLTEFSKDFDISGSSYRYQDSTSTLGDYTNKYIDMFHLDSQTKLFYIPQSGGVASEENMSVADSSVFENGKDYTNITVYDCDDTYQAKALVYKPVDNGTPPPASEYFFVVTGIFKGLNGDNEAVDMVKGLYRGAEKEIEYEIKPGSSSPEIGSIIKYQTTLGGALYIDDANVIYSPSNDMDSDGNIIPERDSVKVSDAFPTVWYQLGRLFRKNGAAITVYDGGTKPIANYLHSGYSVYVIKKNSQNKYIVTKGTDADLRASTGIFNQSGALISGGYDGSQIVTNNRYQYVREIFIIEY